MVILVAHSSARVTRSVSAKLGAAEPATREGSFGTPSRARGYPGDRGGRGRSGRRAARAGASAPRAEMAGRRRMGLQRAQDRRSAAIGLGPHVWGAPFAGCSPIVERERAARGLRVTFRVWIGLEVSRELERRAVERRSTLSYRAVEPWNGLTIRNHFVIPFHGLGRSTGGTESPDSRK